MTQNTSSAVMQQRNEAPDSFDDFPTPPWAGRALIEKVIAPHILPLEGLALCRVWEPACNRGHLIRGIRPYWERCIASDIFNYGFLGQDAISIDFLWPYSDGIYAVRDGVDWIITNPPFQLAEQFIARADQIARDGYAMLVRTSFLEGVGRYTNLFSRNPPTIVAQFAERVIMHKSVLRDPDKEYWDESAQKMRKPSTATSYCWLVWSKHHEPKPMVWIPPCRKEMTRPGDYPEPPRDDRPITLQDALKRGRQL